MNAEQAWINGMQDYRKGLLRSECPHKLDGGFRDAWVLGWRMGLEDGGYIASVDNRLAKGKARDD